MKHAMMATGVAWLVAMGAYAVADDSAKPMSQHSAQMMKECMARQKASNSSLTQSAMETVCKNEIDSQRKEGKDGNDLATGPKADHPRN